MGLKSLNTYILLGAALMLSACSKGGQLTLAPDARIVKSKGSPFVRVNQGGKALIVEQGKTATTGIHGWATVQTVSGSTLSNATETMILNKGQK